MDNLSNRQIKELWAEHFPKRHADVRSKELLDQLAAEVLERAHTGETYYVLLALGIPKREFDQFRLEQKTAQD
jgi:hypothetical protein